MTKEEIKKEVSFEDMMKIYKDSRVEVILRQFHYEHNLLRKYLNAWEELKVIINEDIKTCEEEKVKHPLSKNEWEFAKMTDEEIIKNIENLEEKYKIGGNEDE
jgi:hypothetical protein